ncbi:Ankyrin repeat domain-containing protein 61 [Phlyctochytrium bullatum]|nr:Ankyrin repeat domain-containing protein 61 [Phlyctochytrium bullatum]
MRKKITGLPVAYALQDAGQLAFVYVYYSREIARGVNIITSALCLCRSLLAPWCRLALNQLDDNECEDLLEAWQFNVVDLRASHEGNADIDDDDGLFMLLLDHGANLNARNDDGETPIYAACWFGHAGVVRTLLRHGADALAGSGNTMNDTPLHIAVGGLTSAFNNDPAAVYEICKLLLEAGALSNATDGGENTPLHLACKSKNDQIIGLLLRYGADMMLADNDGKMPLGLAREAARKETQSTFLVVANEL